MTRPVILYNNIVGDATITVTSEDTGYEKENAYDDLTFDFWKPTASGTVYYTMDFGSAVDVDAWGLFAHDLGTNSASIQLQYSTDNFAADTNNFGDAISPSTTEPRLQTGTIQSKRYWRLKIVSAAAASKIGGLILGEHMEIASTSALHPSNDADHLAQRYESVVNESDGGAILGTDKRAKLISGRMHFELLTRAWVRANWDVFKQHCEQGGGFLYQPDPDNYPAEVTYGKATGKIPTPKHMQNAPNQMTVDLPYTGIVT